MTKRILLIDNNDSFTYNLVELLRQITCEFKVINIKDLENIQMDEFSHIIISPGPDIPSAYPQIYEMLTHYHQTKIILGVCLGHQIICEFFGAKTYNLAAPRHGMTGLVTLNKNFTSPIFASLPHEFKVGLYHSWAVSSQYFPPCLQITSTCQDEIVMSVQHTNLPIYGVQFHPESYISQFGLEILQNFILVE